MNKKGFSIALVISLIVGFFIGYVFAYGQAVKLCVDVGLKFLEANQINLDIDTQLIQEIISRYTGRL